MKILKFSFFSVLLLLFATACSKDDDSPSEEETIQQQAENFVTPELIQTLEELGFNFNDGVDSPNIEGVFLYSPTILQATNIDNDSPIGSLFNNLEVEFSNLNPDQRQFTLRTYENSGSQSDEIFNTFYSGTGNSFSAYAKLDATYFDGTITLLYAFSGTIDTDGILDAQQAIIMLENNDVSGVIENGQGRLFNDGDEIASRQEE